MNVSSGVPVGDFAHNILNIENTGKELARSFVNTRLISGSKLFHDPIKRNKIPSFVSIPVKITQGSKVKVVEANRNVLGKLLSLSTKHEKPIDLVSTLSFPLYPVPLSLANPDGSKRCTQKSKLLEIFTVSNTNVEVSAETTSTLIVDFIAQLRVSLTGASGTFEDLIKKFYGSIGNSYRRIDIVADTYRDVSIKSSERSKRGESTKIIIGSVQSKLPADMGKFMLNNENKCSLINMVMDYTSTNKKALLRKLKCQMIYFSTDGETRLFTADSDRIVPELTSDQEEADTKLILHLAHALDKMDKKIILRSPSSDTDIVVLAVALITEDLQQRVIYDSGSGKNRKRMLLSDFSLNDEYKKCLIGFHAFTGNDYVSAFFKKGKMVCWKKMVKIPEFMTLFTKLGEHWEVSRQLVCEIEAFVCNLYGCKKSVSVNAARVELFQKNTYTNRKLLIYHFSHLA